ncbi:hypothetical protein ACFRAE_17500 [Sphingobacterium sp. HJSM2_6]|uniref:hypothetical protein n=1 Tax=Sphingobacterium sp. HJSM2_6 TaxID=3366264 RepID=UPI003BBDFB05
MMKQIIKILLMVLVLVCSCSKKLEIDPNKEPSILVDTKEISISALDQFVLKGEIKSLNYEKIVDIGFIIYDKSKPNPSKPIQISIGTDVSKKDIEYLYRSKVNYQIDQPMSYVFYVQTSRAFYKGQEVNFIVDLLKINQKGSVYAKIGVPIVLFGDFSQVQEADYFSMKGYNSVLFKHKVSADKKSLVLEAPSVNLFHGDNYDLFINQKRLSNEIFEKKIANIEFIGNFNLAQTNYNYNDVIKLTGTGLVDQSDKLKIIIAGKAIHWSNDLKISQFGGALKTTNKVSIDYGNEIVELETPIVLNTPDFSQVKLNNLVTHTKTRVSVSGVNLLKYFDYNNVGISLGTINLPGINIWSDDYTSNVVFTIGDVSHGIYPITFNSSMYDLTIPEKIKLVPFTYEDLDRPNVYTNDVLKVNGSFAIGQRYELEMGEHTRSSTIANSNTELEFKITDNLPGLYDCRITYVMADMLVDFKNSKEFKLEIKNAEITGLSKTTFSPGEEVEIYGKGLQYLTTGFVGQYSVWFSDVSDERVRFTLSNFIPPGEYTIAVNQGNNLPTVFANQKIKVL